MLYLTCIASFYMDAQSVYCTDSDGMNSIPMSIFSIQAGVMCIPAGTICIPTGTIGNQIQAGDSCQWIFLHTGVNFLLQE